MDRYNDPVTEHTDKLPCNTRRRLAQLGPLLDNLTLHDLLLEHLNELPDNDNIDDQIKTAMHTATHIMYHVNDQLIAAVLGHLRADLGWTDETFREFARRQATVSLDRMFNELGIDLDQVFPKPTNHEA